MYNCKPSRDKMGQPSRKAVFTSELDPGIDSKLTAGAQSATEGAAKAGVAKMTMRRLRRATNFLFNFVFVNISIPP
jgi:hypothetical protein